LVGVRRRKLGSRPASRALSQMVVLRYCSLMEIHHALQEPQDTTVNILAVVAVVDASDRTPYYPNENWEVALMNDRYVLKLVFDVY
jgi:hypothetical protein